MFSELLERGILEKIERAPTLELSPRLQLGGKHVFHPHSYTADFMVTWNMGREETHLLTADPDNTPDSIPIFWRHKNTSYLEVKPCFDAHGKTQLANINLKWVYQRYGILVQLIRTGQGERSFFGTAWTPDKFLVTGTGLSRKLNYKLVRSLDDLLKFLRFR